MFVLKYIMMKRYNDMTVELGAWMTVISAIVSSIINVLYNLYKDKKSIRLSIEEKQLSKLYGPIYKKIYDDYYANSCGEEYCGISENTIEKIVKIIQDNNNIADSQLLKWQDDFEEQLVEVQYNIRPRNPDYESLYDKDKFFLKFVESKIKKIKEDLYIE